MFEKYAKYNLRRTVWVEYPDGKVKEIIPRMPNYLGMSEVDLSVADTYRDYLVYLESLDMEYITHSHKYIPTLFTRILLALEYIIGFFVYR